MVEEILLECRTFSVLFKSRHLDKFTKNFLWGLICHSLNGFGSVAKNETEKALFYHLLHSGDSSDFYTLKNMFIFFANRIIYQ